MTEGMSKNKIAWITLLLDAQGISRDTNAWADVKVNRAMYREYIIKLSNKYSFLLWHNQ